MPVAVKGTGGGSVTLSSGAAAADTTLTLPNTTGTVALTASPTFSGTLTATTITSPASTALTFQYGGTTGATLDTSGNLLVGTTTYAGRATFSWVSASQGCLITRSTSETYAGSPVVFQNSSGATAGFISQATSSVSYNTSSDYRMKENVAPLNGGLTTISALKPVTYDWKIDGSSGEGFIAHEVQTVIPHAVTGEKDAVNEDGSVKSQGVDYSKIVVHLVAACQELSAKNDALEARLAALEAK